MPLGQIAANSTLPTPQPDEEPKHQIDFLFDRDVLLKNFDQWGAIVEPELQALPQLFPLSAYLSQTVESLRRIDAVVTKIDKKDLADPLQFLCDLRDEIGPTPGIPCVYSRLEFLEGNPPKANMQFNRFPLDVMALLATV
jgi:hypothetical protein